MCAGGTKVLLGCEMASRGDLAARTLLFDFEADLARREVRLRVGAMIAVVCEDGGGGDAIFFSVRGLGIISRFGGAEVVKSRERSTDESIFTFHFQTNFFI